MRAIAGYNLHAIGVGCSYGALAKCRVGGCKNFRKPFLHWSKMDRTMYGKVLPGTYYPFRCAMKENGISPGCEYLFY